MDTPFGHLDKEHQKNIINSLPNLNSQVIILATDRDLPDPLLNLLLPYTTDIFKIHRLAADEDARNHVWSTQTYEHLFKLWDLQLGHYLRTDSKTQNDIYDTKGLILPPKDFDDTTGTSEMIYSYKFIDQNHYLRITMSQPYAILYKVDSPKPLKYFYLGKDPLPALNDFAQDAAIDSSPSKHILVIAMHADASGILEYQYDPKIMTLKRIWVGDFPATEAEAALAAYKQKTNPTPPPVLKAPTEKLEPQKPWYKYLW
jgi:hypothetical protein